MKIPSKPLLNFVSNVDLYAHVEHVMDIAQLATDNAEKNLYRNAIDPFSAVFEASRLGVSLSQWIELEATRQTQKTLQNAVGDFHQKLIGCVATWKDMGTGSVIDLENKTKKIIAEVKNKHNTTKGNHKVAIYDDIKFGLDGIYKGFTGYYVEIIPKNKKRYNKEFTPSDNKTHSRRPTNKHIRQIDGYSFYELATGEKDALKKLYITLPIVIMDILGKSHEPMIKDKTFLELFNKTY